MDFFIATAAAQAAGATPAQPSMLPSFIMMAAIFAMMYFMMIRPQSKRAKEHRDMLANLQKGDEAVTSGGILGRVTDISEQFVSLEIANGVTIKVQKHAVVAVLPKGSLKAS